VDLAHGCVPWVGELVNRRKDGSFFIEKAVIAPVGGANGEITGYIAVKRDVTNERALSASSARSVAERASSWRWFATCGRVRRPRQRRRRSVARW